MRSEAAATHMGGAWHEGGRAPSTWRGHRGGAIRALRGRQACDIGARLGRCRAQPSAAAGTFSAHLHAHVSRALQSRRAACARVSAAAEPHTAPRAHGSSAAGRFGQLGVPNHARIGCFGRRGGRERRLRARSGQSHSGASAEKSAARRALFSRLALIGDMLGRPPSQGRAPPFRCLRR